MYVPLQLGILDPETGLATMTTHDVIPQETSLLHVVIATGLQAGLVSGQGVLGIT